MTAPVAYRLELWPGGAFTHWKAPPLHGAHPLRSFAFAVVQGQVSEHRGQPLLLATDSSSAIAVSGGDSIEWPVSRTLPTLKRYAA